jgi:hypothetical protein
MKKTIPILLLATLMVFMVPLSSYAGHSHVYGSVNIGVGYHGAYHGGYYGGYHGGYHGGWYRPYYRPWGPGFYWGGSIVVGPPWYPYGYYAAPPAVVQPPPQVYVEPQQPQQNYWYYCQDPQGYYPYVKTCPGGWMKVVPEPAPPK